MILSPRRFVGALALVGLAASGLASASGCSSSSTDTGSGDASTGDKTCPTSPPTPGAPCALADGAECNNYPQATPGCACCGSTVVSYICSQGKWEERYSAASGGGASPAFICPTDVPNNGDSCTPSCGGPSQQCNYDCAHGHGSVSSATCVNGAWHVSQSEIACEAPDAGDGGASDAADGGG